MDSFHKLIRGHRGRDCMVVGFTTIYAISVYHHWCCEFKSRSGRGVQHNVMKFVSDLRLVGGFSPGPPVSSTNKNLPPQYNWNIVESGIKHHQTNKHKLIMVNITVLGIYTKYFRRYTKFNINYSLEDCAVNWIAIIILAISDLALLKKIYM